VKGDGTGLALVSSDTGKLTKGLGLSTQRFGTDRLFVVARSGGILGMDPDGTDSRPVGGIVGAGMIDSADWLYYIDGNGKLSRSQEDGTGTQELAGVSTYCFKYKILGDVFQVGTDAIVYIA
jgi:hypothetical protein